MSNYRKLTRLKFFSADNIGILSRHGVITCKDFLTRSPLELMNILDLTYLQFQKFSAAVSNAAAPKAITALSLYKDRRDNGRGPLPTSLRKLDTVLKGGLPNATITEISGPPGSGKTQFCMMLSVIAALPTDLGGCGMGVVYIDTEAAFTAERLIRMARSRLSCDPNSSKLSHESTSNSISEDGAASIHEAYLTKLAQKVHVLTELTGDSFASCLENLEEMIVSRNVGLVVVDSIASLVRKEFDTSSKRGVIERSSLLMSQASRLKYVAESFQIPVVVTNQITTHVSHDMPLQSNTTNEIGDRGVVTSALGNSWSHCVNTRLLLQFMTKGKRMLTVGKSPVCGCERFVVSIEDRGLVLDWTATGELNDHYLSGEHSLFGDPTLMSLTVHSSVDRGFEIQFPGN